MEAEKIETKHFPKAIGSFVYIVLRLLLDKIAFLVYIQH